MEIRVDRATDGARFLATDEIVWFGEPTSESVDDALRGLPVDQRFAAEVDPADGGPEGAYAGIYGVRPMQLGVPGADGGVSAVPMAGLTWVGVHPDVRRRGVLSAMLRHHVEQTHREGVALSGLHASEPAIYGRHGYGQATQTVKLVLGRGTQLTAPGLDDAAASVTTVLASVGDPGIAARIHALDMAAVAAEPGLVAGILDFYVNIVASSQRVEETRGREPLRFLFARREGSDVGVTAFRRTHKWEDGRPQGSVAVYHLGGDPVSRLVLLRRLLDLDLIGSIDLPAVGLDDPLLRWIGPRSTSKANLGDNLWLRVIDLPAALPLRSYGADCTVVLDVADPAAPWHAGRWRFTVRDGVGHATRTDDAAEVELPVAVLGSMLLGGLNPLAMLAAGQLTEHRPGAVAELAAAFRTRVLPSAAQMF